MKDDRTTLDELKSCGLKLAQPLYGYRFSLDALLLSDFVRLQSGAAVADLGTGCGVIPLLLVRKYPDARVVGFESNTDMAALAGENVRVNEIEQQVEIVLDDIIRARSRYPVSSFDAVVSNPPFRSPRSGKTSPHAGRDAARHETTAGIHDFLAVSKFLVKPAGRICFVYHPSRLAEFLRCASELKLTLLRLRMVHGTDRAVAKIFLAELAKGRKGDLTVEPPLIIYDGGGNYTDEAAAILGS